MGEWTQKNKATLGIGSLVVATVGLMALVKVARLAPKLGDMTLALVPLMVVVALFVAGSLLGLTAVGITFLGGRNSQGAPTPGRPH